ncbi:hypothetical protein EJ06DRAFT_580899 [Trichodelitschia bisporula]|uniref:Uncharacterized protein n=1 Tax=Trichodelitschia bisporula TaxID=703511 RepID=A0A6G1I0V9_9PEZI|nr:hypothetical protein EJ06DRAFT_580899 [Trichodelitschia bisporula]
MELATVITKLLEDIQHLDRLYGQLANVPQHVHDLFLDIVNCRSRLAQLECDKSAFAAVQPLKDFRKRLLDLELFIDPDQVLPRSGLGSALREVVPWLVTDMVHVQRFCDEYRGHVRELDAHCTRLEAGLSSLSATFTPQDQDTASDALPMPDATMAESRFNFSLTIPPIKTEPLPSPSTFAAPKDTLTSQPERTPLNLAPSGPPSSLSSPALSALAGPRQKSRAAIRIQELVDQHCTPIAGAKRKHVEESTTHVRVVQDFIQDTAPFAPPRPFAPAQPLTSPPLYASSQPITSPSLFASSQPTTSPLFASLQATTSPPFSFSSQPATSSPLFPSSASRPLFGAPQPFSAPPPFTLPQKLASPPPFTPPPSHTSPPRLASVQPPKSPFTSTPLQPPPPFSSLLPLHSSPAGPAGPKSPPGLLSPRHLPEDDIPLSLSELTLTLPVSARSSSSSPWHAAPPSLPHRPRPHQTRTTFLAAGAETASLSTVSTASTYASTSSSSHSHPSSASSISRLSLTSDLAHARPFAPDACKLWYRRGSALQSASLMHLEVRLKPQPRGAGTAAITLISKTSTGQEIVDDLWMTAAGANNTPFLENVAIVAAFRARDPRINFVVRFAPHASFHPQYSFVNRDEAWGFVEAITGRKVLTSVDVESIKSALTHGNAQEAGCETLQVLDGPGGRVVRFVRNKNPAAGGSVVEVDAACIRPPKEAERRGRKMVLGLRDGVGIGRELRYLKVVFGSEEGREEFLNAVGV